MPNEQDNTTPNNNFTASDPLARQLPSQPDTFTQDGPTNNAVVPGEVEPSTSSVASMGADAGEERTSSWQPSSQPEQPPAAPVAPVQFGAASAQPAFGASQTPAAPAFGTSISSEPVPPKKSKKGLVIGAIVAGVATLLIGGSAAAYNLWYQNPDKVIGDALSNMLTSESMKTDSVVVVKDEADKSEFKLTLNTQGNQNDARIDAKLDSEHGGKSYEASGSVLVKGSNKFYIKVDKLRELLEQSGLMAYAGSSPSIDKLITKLDGSWVVIDEKDIEELSGSEDDASKCVEDVTAKLRTDDSYADELSDLYKKHPLVSVVNKLGSKNGSLGYEIEFNRANAVAFTNGVNSTKFYKELKKCDSKIEDLDGEDMFKEDDTDSKSESKVVVWVDRWTHQFTKFEVSGKSEESSGSIVTNLQFNTNVDVKEPADPITVDELKADVEAITQEMMQANTQYYDMSEAETNALNEQMNTSGTSQYSFGSESNI